MKTTRFLWVGCIRVLVVLVGLSFRVGVMGVYPPDMGLAGVREMVGRSGVGHPRLLVDARGWERVRGEVRAGGMAARIAERVLAEAEIVMDAEPVRRELEGRRLLGRSRECLERVLVLATAFQLWGDERYVRRAEREMLAVARFEDWNPGHFLDVAEMTMALGLGYDWLYGELGEGERGEIREAIIQKGVELPWVSGHRGWVRSGNNWGQVCHGGLVAGALAVMEDEPDLAAKTVHSALENVVYSMGVYAPRGSYPEGPGYWAYGTGYNVLLVAILESVLGTDFGLAEAPGFSETGSYPALVCGPSGQFFNYADGGSGRSPQPFLWWFARRFGRADWLWGEEELLGARMEAKGRGGLGGLGGRFFPLTLLWLGGEAGGGMRMPLHWSGGGEVPVTIHRSSWEDPDAVFVGLKGGSPSANHGHMDVGSFVLDADGVRWAEDLGAEGYHGIESRGMNLWDRSQGSDRWTIFRQRNESHNTLVIDDELQVAAGSGEVVAFSDDGDFPHSILDMTTAYGGQAESVRRGVGLTGGGEVVIQDELRGLREGAVVRWGMVTRGEVEGGGGRVRLKQRDRFLSLTIVGVEGGEWKVVDTAEPRREWDSPNQGTRMVAFEVRAPASGELRWAVVMTPGSCEASVLPGWGVKVLDEWGKREAGGAER